MRDQTQLSCIVCGCKNAHTATAPFNLTEAEQITRDVASIDQQIQLLHVKRTSLLKKLNSIQSVTYNIPSEVLSYIMEMATNEENDRARPINQLSSFIPLHLSSVSSYWRQVARSTPVIWTSLRLEFDNYFSVNAFVKNKVALLRDYFERAKSLPLSLVYRNCGRLEPQIIKTLLDVAVHDNPTQIKSLTAPAEAMAAWQGERTVYSQLQHLEITGQQYWRPPKEWTLPIAPKLQHITLNRAIIPSIPSNITHLHLYTIPYSCCIRMLLECQQTIIEFKLVAPYATPNRAIPLPALGNTTYTLPRLRTLNCDLSRYEEIPTAFDTLILQHLNLPSLREASFINITENHIRLGTPTPLMKTRTSVLSSVYVSGSESFHEFQRAEIAHLFDQVDTKRLFIDFTAQEVLNTLHTLIPSLHPKNKILIPTLEELCVTYSVKHGGLLFDSTSKALVKMLEERRCGGTLGNPFFIAFQKKNNETPSGQTIQGLTNYGVLKFTRCGTVSGHGEMVKYLVTFK